MFLKNKWCLIMISISIVICVLLLVIPSISDKRLFNNSEDEIYGQMSKLSEQQLIKKINRLEKKNSTIEGQTQLIPLYLALIDKANSFTKEQLISQIKDTKTLSGIDKAFVKMYIENGYDTSSLLALLNDSTIIEETKEYIVSQCNLTADELFDIFKKFDSRVAVVAIKKLAVVDSNRLLSLVNESLSSHDEKLADEKSRAICLAIAGYYEELQDGEEKNKVREKYAPILQQIFDQSSSPLVKNEAIYALGRICDNSLFAWIIENESIDKYTKISVIERNFKMIQKLIESAQSESDISSVIKAMHILPLIDIADNLQNAIDAGNLPASEKLTSLIEYIQKEGIPAVDKYE